MDTDQNTYLDAIREYVCSVCRTPGAHDWCGASDSEPCAVERFLPRIMEVAVQIDSEDMDDYVSALRDTICRVCKPGGEAHCSARDAQLCGLDRYFVLIIEAIEQVILRQRNSRIAGAPAA